METQIYYELIKDTYICTLTLYAHFLSRYYNNLIFFYVSPCFELVPISMFHKSSIGQIEQVYHYKTMRCELLRWRKMNFLP